MSVCTLLSNLWVDTRYLASGISIFGSLNNVANVNGLRIFLAARANNHLS